MRTVQHYMGMPISLDIPHCKNKSVFSACWQLCEQIDQQFSPYISTSEVSRIAIGSLLLQNASPTMQDIATLADGYDRQTNGYFSIYFNGVFNPTGIVKAWAIKQLALYIEASGYGTYLINAGGDILCNSITKKRWQLAISSPLNPNSTIGTITADNLAIATSGSYQKGAHIYDPKTGTPTTALKSVTVIGPDIITADVYATALYAMGLNALPFAKTLVGYSSYIIDANNVLYSF